MFNRLAGACRTLFALARMYPAPAILLFAVPWCLAVIADQTLAGIAKWIGFTSIILFASVVFWIVMRKTLLITLLVVSMTGVQPRPVQASPEVVIYVVALGVGIYMLVSLNRYCQKHFGNVPKLTNSPSDFVFAPSIAASYQLEPVPIYWPCDDTESTPSTTYSIVGTITAHGFVPGPLRILNGDFTQGEFNRDVASHGISALDESYAVNGQPVTAAQSPIQFRNGGRTIRYAPIASTKLRSVTMEQSPDNRNWTPMLTIEAAEGTVLTLQGDSRDPMRFHRFKNNN